MRCVNIESGMQCASTAELSNCVIELENDGSVPLNRLFAVSIKCTKDIERFEEFLLDPRGYVAS